MIDKIKAQKEFKKYVEKYDITNEKISFKVAHTYRTAEVAEQIAKSVTTNENDIDLAWIIGLLHDIGRFEQLRVYDTFNDMISIDHADFGVKLLFEDKLIERFIDERKYDDIIYKAIKNHNKYRIEEGLNNKELLHAKIIRDADKTDIFEVHVKDIEASEHILHDEEKLKKEFITPEVLEDFLQHKSGDKKKIKNDIDQFVIEISFIYDYNFKKGLEIIKERNYIPRKFKILDGCEETKEQRELIKREILSYLEKC